MDELVQAAEVGKGSFYNHFPDRETLVRAVSGQIRATVEGAIGRRVEITVWRNGALVDVVAVLGAVLLAMQGIRDQAAFFYAPGDVARKGVPLDRAVRIGGI